MSIHIATDVGGTFTDLVLYDYDPETLRGELKTLKVDTTPPHFEKGVLHALEKSGADLAQVAMLAHGSTIVINALTERRGAKTALITTAGFRDVLEIARGNRPDLFNLNYVKPAPFVERYLRYEISERTDYLGKLQQSVCLDKLSETVDHMRANGVEAVAVCLLHAYRNPANEQQLADELRRLMPEVPVLASHEISGEWREYERSNTTVASAYVSPVVQNYVRRLENALEQQAFGGDLYLMQSNGGMTNTAAAIANPVSMVESGPASGMLAAQALGSLIGEHNLIALDVGGTTAKCTLIHQGQLPVTTEYHIERTAKTPGYPIQTAVVDLVEIGQGGGSIASVDAGGRLSVGPRSAGAMPGPVAYGRGGTDPTTTDANLYLGRIDHDNFFAAEPAATRQLLATAFGELGQQAGLGADGAAEGVLRLANANMVNALKLVSTNKGYDPRDFSLMAFGGGGALHAVELAEELQIPRVIIPANAAVFSAWGMLLTDIRRDYTQTRLQTLNNAAAPDIVQRFEMMREHARRDFDQTGMTSAEMVFAEYVDLRYRGQEHTVKVALDSCLLASEQDFAAFIERFHAAHESRYTFRLDNATVELVNFHLVASVYISKPKPQLKDTSGSSTELALIGRRQVFFEHHGYLTAQVYRAEKMSPGMAIRGPAIVQDKSSSLVLPPTHGLYMDSYGNFIIDLHVAEDRRKS